VPRIGRGSARSGRLLIVAGAVAIAALTTVSLSLLASKPAQTSGAAMPASALTDRALKADLIGRLASPPKVVILGGSRALRFDPAYVQARTGLSGFNAAVPHARPIDEWAFMNLLRQRFPGAVFHALWIIHVDEFDSWGPSPALLTDPTLARFLPPALIADGAGNDGAPAARAFRFRQIAPDGATISDEFDRWPATPAVLAARVRRTSETTVAHYATHPPRLSARARRYFQQTLRLFNDQGVAPVIVMAPLQPRYLAAVAHRGWGARHRMVLRYLRSLRGRYAFRLLDLSRLASIGGSPSGFYDGIHLRASTANQVVDKVLRAYPTAFTVVLKAQTP